MNGKALCRHIITVGFVYYTNDFGLVPYIKGIPNSFHIRSKQHELLSNHDCPTDNKLEDDAHIHQLIESVLVQIMACHLTGIRPLRVLIYCQNNTSKIWIKIKTFSFNKMHLKASRKWQPFCSCLKIDWWVWKQHLRMKSHQGHIHIHYWPLVWMNWQSCIITAMWRSDIFFFVHPNMNNINWLRNYGLAVETFMIWEF